MQGDTLSVYATEISTTNKQYRLWQKGQFAVLISRARQCRDIIFVGEREQTRAAIEQILQESSLWDEFIRGYLSSLNALGNGSMREVSLDLHPFKPLYRELPTATCGYIYQLISIPHPEKCYVGDCDDLKQCLRRHNTGHGTDETRPTVYHPWAVYSFVCGFDVEDVALGRQERHSFMESLRYDRNGGPDVVYGHIHDDVAAYAERAVRPIVMVKCGQFTKSATSS